MNNLKKNIYKITTTTCNLQTPIITTTDPTNVGNNNGTATVTYVGNEENISYSLNGGLFIPVMSSPFIITGLQSNMTYNLQLKDNVEEECIKNASFSLGESSFIFEADYIMMVYEFTDGRDLDTRTRIVTPNIGQNTQNDYLGWGRKSLFPSLNVPFETWGGDNTGTGFESVLIDITTLKSEYPLTTNVTIDTRAFWYGTKGLNNVNISATMWKGGLPVKTGFKWLNTTADRELIISSTGKPITLVTKASTSSGERVATFKYNLITKEGLLDNNDILTPSV